MDPETLRRIKESEALAQDHEQAKTAHYSRLGGAFAKGGSTLRLAGGRGGGTPR